MLKKKIFFSILIPNLGMSDALFECLNSVYTQNKNSSFDYEIIVCDQSDEKIYELILKKSQKLFSNEIIFIHSNVRSLFHARHTLMEQAKGDYVVFVDSDDFVSKDFLESIYNDLAVYDYPDILIHHLSLCSYDGSPYEHQIPFPSDIQNNVMNYFLYSFTINSVVMKIFKKTLYKTCNYDMNSRVTNGEDKVFSFPLMTEASTIFVDAKLDKYFYRQNKESMTHNPNFADMINGLKIIVPPISLVPKTSYQKIMLTSCLLQYYVSSSIVLLCNHKIDYKNFKQLTSLVLYYVRLNSLNISSAKGLKNKTIILLLFFKLNRLLYYILKRRAKKYL